MAGASKAPKFAPVQAVAPDKAPPPFLNDENQATFHTMFWALNRPQRAAVTTVLDLIISKPFLNQGYKAFFNYWRQYRGLHTDVEL